MVDGGGGYSRLVEFGFQLGCTARRQIDRGCPALRDKCELVDRFDGAGLYVAPPNTGFHQQRQPGGSDWAGSPTNSQGSMLASHSNQVPPAVCRPPRRSVSRARPHRRPDYSRRQGCAQTPQPHRGVVGSCMIRWRSQIQLSRRRFRRWRVRWPRRGPGYPPAAHHYLRRAPPLRVGGRNATRLAVERQCSTGWGIEARYLVAGKDSIGQFHQDRTEDPIGRHDWRRRTKKLSQAVDLDAHFEDRRCEAQA